jgi:hypothetical protein
MKLFITYASEDGATADALAVRLRTEGHTVFLDRDNLPEAEGYDAQIRSAIASCDVYLFLISPRSVQPGRYTLTELKFARERFPNPQGRVLPVMVEPTPFKDIPAFLSAVTVLQPQGNLVAETLAEVGVMQTRPVPASSKPVERDDESPPGDAESAQKRNWWTTLPGVLTGAAAVITALTGLVAVFVPRDRPTDRPAAETQAPQAAATPSTPPPAATQPAALPGAARAPVLPRIVLDGPAEVSFEKVWPSTYRILGIETGPRTPTHYGLRVKLRLLNRDRYPMNFWDDSFRLLIDGVPSAPDSNLNELVPGNAAKDGEVSFPVPHAAQTLALRVIQHDETADLPLRSDSGAAPARPAEIQTGGQSVKTGDIGAGAQVNIQQKQ